MKLKEKPKHYITFPVITQKQERKERKKSFFVYE